MISPTERFQIYEQHNQTNLLTGLPTVIRVSGRNFKRLCKALPGPLNEDMAYAMAMAMFYSVKEIPEAIFAYQYSDQIFIVLQPQESVWLNGNIVDISSTIASLITFGLQQTLQAAKINLSGDTIFRANVFNLPKISEVYNYLFWRQMCAKNFTLTQYLYAHLETKMDKIKIFQFLKDKNLTEKENLLQNLTKLSIHECLPTFFYHGYGLYKIQVPMPAGGETYYRNKWHLDADLPSFKEEKDFILNILKNGHDIVRDV